jgi:two-component system LytT family response regulator
MFRALIIDDEPLACDLVEEYLGEFDQIEVVGRCNDGFEGMKAISEKKPDLIFLDVQMPKITGFEMLELLEEPPAIIFTTAFDEYAIKAFEKNAVDYLLKPYSEERFAQAVRKFLDKPDEKKSVARSVAEESRASSQPSDRVVIKDGAKIRIIPIPEVIRLEADDDYVKVYSAQGNFMKKQTLKNFEEGLSADHFVRVHRSHLVNIMHIERIDPYEKNAHVALLKNGERIPVSRSGYQRVKELLQL